MSASTIAGYLQDHASTAMQPATLAAATLTSDHLVFWIASATFVVSGVLAAALFRTGPLPVTPDAAPVLAR